MVKCENGEKWCALNLDEHVNNVISVDSDVDECGTTLGRQITVRCEVQSKAKKLKPLKEPRQSWRWTHVA